MKLEVGKTYKRNNTVVEVRFFDKTGGAWGLSTEGYAQCINSSKHEWQEVTDTPDPGEGWRLLDPDEDVEEGDEYFSDCDGRWMQSNNYRTNNCIQTREVTYRRRIAPQYVPYTWDDREELRGRWLKSKHAPHCEFVVLEFKSMSGIHLRVNGIDAVALLEHYVWLDGTPCGKKVE